VRSRAAWLEARSAARPRAEVRPAERLPVEAAALTAPEQAAWERAAQPPAQGRRLVQRLRERASAPPAEQRQASAPVRRQRAGS